MPAITGPQLCKPPTEVCGSMTIYLKNTKKMRAYAIDMENDTIFTVGFYKKISTGALLLVSDSPMLSEGVRQKPAARK